MAPARTSLDQPGPGGWIWLALLWDSLEPSRSRESHPRWSGRCRICRGKCRHSAAVEESEESEEESDVIEEEEDGDNEDNRWKDVSHSVGR